MGELALMLVEWLIGCTYYYDITKMAAGLGFEPRWTDSESAILPLDDPAIML